MLRVLTLMEATALLRSGTHVIVEAQTPRACGTSLRSVYTGRGGVHWERKQGKREGMTNLEVLDLSFLQGSTLGSGLER